MQHVRHLQQPRFGSQPVQRPDVNVKRVREELRGMEGGFDKEFNRFVVQSNCKQDCFISSDLLPFPMCSSVAVRRCRKLWME